MSQPLPAPLGIDAVIVQGNVSQGQKWSRDSAIAAFERELALTRAGVAEAGTHPSVVIWPETSTFFSLQGDQGAEARLAIADAAKPALASLVGGLTFDQRRRLRRCTA